MTDKKITALGSAAVPLAGTEVIPMVQSGATVKATVADIVGAGTSPGRFTTVAASSNITMTAVNPGLLFNTVSYQVYKQSTGIRIYTEGVDRAIFNASGLTVTGLMVSTTVKATAAAGYVSSDGSTGFTGTVTSASLTGKTITIKDGIITAFA